jgi:hypothetical protein
MQAWRQIVMIDGPKRVLGVNQLLRQRALANQGRKDADPDSRARPGAAQARRRQVQMGEVIKNQQHA